jgi:hypothetical protein
MRLLSRDQKPQSQSPPAPCWGFFFLGWPSWIHIELFSLKNNALLNFLPIGPFRFQDTVIATSHGMIVNGRLLFQRFIPKSNDKPQRATATSALACVRSGITSGC